MLVLLFIVVSYALANYYFYFKLSYVLNLSSPINIALALLVFFQTVSPVLVLLYSHRGSERALKIFSYTTYLWLAFLVIFSPAGIILDLYNLIVRSGFSAVDTYRISPENSLLIPLVLSLCINIYGYYEARNLSVERLVLPTSKLPAGIKKLRIAQISDLHLRIIAQDKIFNAVIEALRDEKPDILVSTGDLVDGSVRHITHLAEKFKDIHAPLGKFAIMGNHEIYGGTKQTAEYIEDAGFTLLRDEGITVDNIINLAGMDFSGGEAAKSVDTGNEPELEILSRLPGDRFTLLLKHRSDIEPESLGLFDLQLSGHTHKGQIFPMSLATMFLFQHHSGFTKLSKGSSIHVSRGTGTSGPPVRFLSRPEITIIDIVSE